MNVVNMGVVMVVFVVVVLAAVVIVIVVAFIIVVDDDVVVVVVVLLVVLIVVVIGSIRINTHTTQHFFRAKIPFDMLTSSKSLVVRWGSLFTR